MGTLFENDRVLVENFPMLHVRLLPRSRTTTFRLSEWDLRRWTEELASGVSPIHIQASLSSKAGDIRVAFVDTDELLLFETVILKNPHVIGDIPITVQFVPSSMPNSDVLLWEKSRSLWIKGIPSKLFEIMPSDSILFKEHALWVMLSRVCGDTIERMEVAVLDNDASNIGISFTSDVCVRFSSFSACKDTYSAFSGPQSHLRKCLIAMPSINRCVDTSPLSAVSAAMLRDRRMYVMEVTPDLTGYLRKQNIHHRQHIRRKHEKAREKFADRLAWSTGELEQCRMNLDSQLNRWRSECELDANGEPGAVEKGCEFAVIAAAQGAETAIANALETIARVSKKVQFKAETANERNAAYICQCADDITPIVQGTAKSLEDFMGISTTDMEKMASSKKQEEQRRRALYCAQVYDVAADSMEKRERELDTIESAMKTVHALDQLLPTERAKKSAKWRVQSAEVVGQTLKSSRSLQTALKKLLAKFDKTKMLGSIQDDLDRIAASLQSCVDMRVAEWKAVLPVLVPWRVLLEVEEDSAYARAAATDLLSRILTDDRKTAIASTLHAVPGFITASDDSDRGAACHGTITREILFTVVVVAEKCMEHVHSYFGDFMTGSVPTDREIQLLQSVYPTLYALILPLKTHLVDTENLLRRSRARCISVAESSMQLRVSCVNRTDPVSSAPYSSTSLTKVGHVSTPAAIWADALKVAVDNTEYRLARAEGMARSALQPLLALLCAQSDVHLQKTSASAVSTRNFQPNCSAMDRWEEVFANTCAVSGLELLSAWEGLEMSCMQHEDEMGRALQTEELREERARASCQVMMSLEDDRSSVLRTIDHLLARETALVAVLHKRDKVLSGDYSLDRWGGGGRHAKLTTTDKSCDGAYRDMYGRKNGSGNGFFAGVEELDGVLVRSPLWWSSESSGTDVLKDDRECDRYGKRRIGRKRKKSPPQAAGSEGDTRKRLRSVVGYPGSVYTQQSADSISKPLSPSVDRRLSDGHVMLNEEKVLKEILLRKKLINRINK